MTNCVGMILAGGQGSRLGALTKDVAKPAVPFGGKYRIIDFALSNCTHSGIEAVGVLTQYQPLELNTYIGNGVPWDLDRNYGGVYVLPPYVKAEKGEWYKGTANAIYQNIGFIEQFNPNYVLIMSGDHIYKMDYSKMLKAHVAAEAEATVAVMPVPWEEASRFGIMNVDEESRIVEFEEKPKEPKSNLASMGIYIFNWQTLKKYLIVDENNPRSENDFGKNIIPQMLTKGEKMYAYHYEDYWRDVGTIQSLWEAHMDMLSDPPLLDINDPQWRIF
ncbi:MAG: glucose-1-phosphate adenylyltransferase, partial [Clostridia bacterium]|nr:glucose-1-phosphate adenylyltransferase [Clostridia bacterium]